MDEEHYIFLGEHFKVLLSAQYLIDHELAPVRVKFMSPEERKRWELAERQKELAKEEMRKK